jgi:hypothetical protein
VNTHLFHSSEEAVKNDSLTTLPSLPDAPVMKHTFLPGTLMVSIVEDRWRLITCNYKVMQKHPASERMARQRIICRHREPGCHLLLLRQLKEAKEFHAQTVILNEVKDPSSIPTMPYGFFASLRMTTNYKPY